MIDANIIEDSINTNGDRLTTIQMKLPKVLLAELNTHRVFSRNAASSRAIPTAKFQQLDTWYPISWGKNQAGMSAKQEELEGAALVEAKRIWEDTIEYCKKASERLTALGLHKQWANRPMDWCVYVDDIVTSTEWDNFIALRNHPSAQPEMQALAVKVQQALKESAPKLLTDGQWHLPYVTQEERKSLTIKDQLVVSSARCCRVSYNNHGGALSSLEQDYATYEKLGLHQNEEPKHLSPAEHQATPDSRMDINLDYPYAGSWNYEELHGNFAGWIQHRKLLERNYAVEYFSD